MSAYLLDVNVLVALAWPNHVHHAIALDWFHGRRGEEGWATCPITQNGFVRVSSNHRALPEARTPREALQLLGRITALPGHVFWVDDIGLDDSPFLDPARLVGYRQVTDAHLLAIALRHGGRLATLDRAVSALLPMGFDPGSVHCITA